MQLPTGRHPKNERLTLVLMLAGLSSAYAQAEEEDAGVEVVVAVDTFDAGIKTEVHAAPSDLASDELALFALESQMTASVSSATKVEQTAAQTPAIVTIITADEIQARGYTSVAEALRVVPGFYDSYDLITHNVGVRGINGGLRASGNVLKVMIDGQPVDYRPSTGNFLGEELIPIGAVERIEVIRGPGSALYGANAFLGVINVITRSGASVGGVRVTGKASMIRGNLGGGGALTAGGTSGPVDVMVGISGLHLNRSGLTLPSSSPGPDAPAIAARGASRDYTKPISAIGKASFDLGANGKVTALASLQLLDADAEFEAYQPLSRRTRVLQSNQNYRLSYEVTPSDTLSIRASGHYFRAAPREGDQIDIGRQEFVLVRNVSAEGFGFAAEVAWSPLQQLRLTLGADFVREHHVLQTFDRFYVSDLLNFDGSVFLKSGSRVPLDAISSRLAIQNEGAYVQAYAPLGSFGFVGNVRVDHNSIYQWVATARVGGVYSTDTLSLKLLYGSSFKAPSAEQLYTQPVRRNDIQGNRLLGAQRAHTIELSGGLQLPNSRGEISLNIYTTNVLGRVEFIQRGLYFQAQNLPSEWIVGGELDGRFVLTSFLQLRVMAGVAKTVASESEMGSLSAPVVLNALFPSVQVHTLLDFVLPWGGVRISPELSLVGPRLSSQSNSLIAGNSYVMPAYLYTGISISSTKRKLWGERETNFALRFSNLLNQQWGEPGFNGYDLPVPGVTGMLTVEQQF